MALDRFFRPRSVAVIGAAREPGKVGHEVLANLISAGFPGPIYPVNPSAEEILGVPCHPSITAIDREIDLAVVVVPAPAVARVIRECGEAGVEAAIVITAGFREAGREGAALEREVLDAARAGGVRVLGPNCLGIVSTPSSLNASFARGMPPRGRISFLSQSGALGTAILDWSVGEGLGIAHFVSLGNRGDLSEADLLEEWAADPDTAVIVGYLESIADGQAFLRAAEVASASKPVIMLKAGSSDAGARAVSSHTGSLAGSDTAYEAALRAVGVVRASTVQELFDLASAHARQPLPAGRGMAILTNAGGPAVIATDRAERLGCALAALDSATIDRLRETLPPAAALYNPVDILGDAPPARYAAAFEALADDSGVHSALVILTPQAMSDPATTAAEIVRIARESGLPTVTSFMGNASVMDARTVLREGGIPDFPFPERAVSALAALHDRSDLRNVRTTRDRPAGINRDGAHALVRAGLAEGRTLLAEERSARVAEAYGVRVPPGDVAGDLDEALAAAELIGYPVALKIASPEIVHKSDIGGIRVGLETPAELAQAYDEVIDRARAYARDAVIDGVHVQKMAPAGREVIIGVDRDPVFGPMLMFGLGGIYVEVMRDVTFRLCPVDEEEARRMIREIRAFGLLRGARGQAPADLDAVADALVRISYLAYDLPEVMELDINPLIVGNADEGVWAADVRIGIGGTS